MIDKYLQPLKSISELLSNVPDNWAIVGSMNHYIQGLNLVPKDIDIITTKKGIFVIEEALQKYSIKKVNYYEKDTIRSFYGKFSIASMNVELFSEIENRIDNKWNKHPDWKASIIHCRLDNIVFPLLSLEYESYIYKILGMKERERKILNKIEKP